VSGSGKSFYLLFLAVRKVTKEAALQPIFPRPAGFHGGIKNSLPFNRSKILSL
jgi:hypothetical protein